VNVVASVMCHPGVRTWEGRQAACCAVLNRWTAAARAHDQTAMARLLAWHAKQGGGRHHVAPRCCQLLPWGAGQYTPLGFGGGAEPETHRLCCEHSCCAVRFFVYGWLLQPPWFWGSGAFHVGTSTHMYTCVGQ
jgi:hypothetical protein